MAFGLPIAVTIGWTLATPARRPTLAGPPGGAGGIGAAPERTVTAEPLSAVRYPSRPFRPPTSPAVSTSPTPAPSGPPAPTSPAPSPSSSAASLLPPLTLPPVPTPTEEATSTADPSTPPSLDPSVDPSTQP